ncbi:hypothetical protein COX84_00920 [Candidatus Micrarchaeota archaeon CG_4_10_14_0_2_um_filter_49_7]|nr:MAG: hypothetical protein AUJ13_04190 [Candidatus Micrarchaeota archaeon CG1_02_49_24]PIU82563.1 MAG: hypothetical protein COS70_00650 [Candidatus Micrarchaeota archaeon CG06_land_8_20_14_3_00_50_6]PIZ99503.1 MAG: hypothetical protein COX84_00920 [Candidatus Micrarchaeota archaeon CG_4_10_14_0_2_um_filter_49_7]HII53424.1 phosphoenolpyruvate carboxykinase (ATP) [Candidatus Micrarchaeota archaeon]
MDKGLRLSCFKQGLINRGVIEHPRLLEHMWQRAHDIGLPRVNRKELHTLALQKDTRARAVGDNGVEFYTYHLARDPAAREVMTQDRPDYQEGFRGITATLEWYARTKGAVLYEGIVGHPDSPISAKVAYVHPSATIGNLHMLANVLGEVPADRANDEPDMLIVSNPSHAKTKFYLYPYGEETGLAFNAGNDYGGPMKKIWFMLHWDYCTKLGYMPLHAGHTRWADTNGELIDLAVIAQSGGGKSITTFNGKRIWGDDNIIVDPNTGIGYWVEYGSYAKADGLTMKHNANVLGTLERAPYPVWENVEWVESAEGVLTPDYCDLARTKNMRISVPFSAFDNWDGSTSPGSKLHGILNLTKTDTAPPLMLFYHPELNNTANAVTAAVIEFSTNYIDKPTGATTRLSGVNRDGGATTDFVWYLPVVMERLHSALENIHAQPFFASMSVGSAGAVDITPSISKLLIDGLVNGTIRWATHPFRRDCLIPERVPGITDETMDGMRLYTPTDFRKFQEDTLAELAGKYKYLDKTIGAPEEYLAYLKAEMQYATTSRPEQ